MRKQLFLLLIAFLIGIQITNAQDPNLPVYNRLHSRLAGLTCEKRINFLNFIAMRYMNLHYTLIDSARYYAEIAVKESKEIGFKKGESTGYYMIAECYLRRTNPRKAEPYLKRAIPLAHEFGWDTVLLSSVYRSMGQCKWYLADYNEAIRYINISTAFAEKMEDYGRVIDNYCAITDIYDDQGKYEKAFDYAQRAYEMSQRLKNRRITIHTSTRIGDIHMLMGDYESAVTYLTVAYALIKDSCRGCWDERMVLQGFGQVHLRKGNYDSALYYFNKNFIYNPQSSLTRMFLAQTYNGMRRYKQSLDLLLPLLPEMKVKANEGPRYDEIQMTIANTYLGLGNNTKALSFATQALQTAKHQHTLQNIRDINLLLSVIYKKLDANEQSFTHYEQYVAFKDSTITDKIKLNVYAYQKKAESDKASAQLELLKKNQKINEQELKIREQELDNSRVLKNALTGGIIILIIGGLFLFRYISLKRKNERLHGQKVKNDLQHKATELEMQALRAQMNPHFIFNCLSSINRFILKNEAEAASGYLINFSKLIRLSLSFSQLSTVSLTEELEFLRLYLDMERLRFKDGFEYDISFTDSVDPDIIQIPPLLFQPFCENAIWHGLMHKDGIGKLGLSLENLNDNLRCVITDNGIGRRKAAMISGSARETHKSFGLKLTSERLALFNEENGTHTGYLIEDVSDEAGNVCGTRVIIDVKYKRA